MNCRPGDRAVIVHPKRAGHLVLVMYEEPATDFTLPDGYWALVSKGGPFSWVCESLGSLFDAPVKTKYGISTRNARYAVIPDKWLRPIRDPGEDARDETLEWLPVPSHTKETV